MTAKTYLKQIKLMNLKIQQMQKNHESLLSSLTGSGIDYAKDKVQTSPSDQMLEVMTKAVDLSNDINNAIIGLNILKCEVSNRIHRLDDARYIKTLYMRYIELMTFEEIAVECHYSFDYVLKLHGDALDAFEICNNDIL